MKLQLKPVPGLDDLLDLPWHQPLDDWDHRDEAPRGCGSTTAVDVDGAVFELREMPAIDADRANHLLRTLQDEGVATVDVVGIVVDRLDRDANPLPAVLVTERPSHAFAYEELLSAHVPDAHDAVVDAAVTLLVQLHLTGFVWREASLSRMCFGFDAGGLGATLVEVGAGDLVDDLATVDRLSDLEVAVTTIAEELVAADIELDDPVAGIHALRHDIRSRYRDLWRELTQPEQVDIGDGERGDARLRRVNELGFDVEEIQVTGEDGSRVRVEAAVLEPGHHRRRLQRLTHLSVRENQARRLLAELDHFRVTTAALSPATTTGEASGRAPASEAVTAQRWLREVFRPTVESVPSELRRRGQDDAEVFHEILEHRYYLSERAGHDVGTQAATDAYVADVLASPDERPAR